MSAGRPILCQNAKKSAYLIVGQTNRSTTSLCHLLADTRDVLAEGGIESEFTVRSCSLTGWF